MAFKDMSQQIAWNILRGQDLILQAKIPNRIVRQHINEVTVLQHQLDAVMDKFNNKIKELEARGENETSNNPKKELSEEDKAVLLKIEKDKKKEGGGTII